MSAHDDDDEWSILSSSAKSMDDVVSLDSDANLEEILQNDSSSSEVDSIHTDPNDGSNGTLWFVFNEYISEITFTNRMIGVVVVVGFLLLGTPGVMMTRGGNAEAESSPFIPRRNITQYLRDEINGQVSKIQKLVDEIDALKTSNERYVKDLALASMDRNSWRSLAYQCVQELENALDEFEKLESSVKKSKMLVPIQVEDSTLWNEGPHVKNVSLAEPGGNTLLLEKPHNAVIVASSTAVAAV